MGYEIMHSYRIKEFRNLHIANKVTHLAIVTIVVNRDVSFFFSFLFLARVARRQTVRVGSF